jgi:hypothetical protein
LANPESSVGLIEVERKEMGEEKREVAKLRSFVRPCHGLTLIAVNLVPIVVSLEIKSSVWTIQDSLKGR